MHTINITTSQNIDIEYELASLGDRILGRIIDWVILGAYLFILFFSVNFFDFAPSFNVSSWVLIFFLLPVLFYDLISEIYFSGQSAGKRIMGIKVISLSGAQPSFGQYLNRWLFRVVDFSLCWGLVAFIVVAVSEKKQRVGDLVAGTVLVKTKPRSQLSHTIFEPVEETNYQVTYPEAVNLNDHDIQLIKEVLLTVENNGNYMLALQAQQKVEQALHIISLQSDAKMFLQVIIADFNHLTSKM